jgi:hypothetical protein
MPPHDAIRPRPWMSHSRLIRALWIILCAFFGMFTLGVVMLPWFPAFTAVVPSVGVTLIDVLMWLSMVVWFYHGWTAMAMKVCRLPCAWCHPNWSR